MWHCEACGYHNEDLDDACARCGAEHVSGQALQRPEQAAAASAESLHGDAVPSPAACAASPQPLPEAPGLSSPPAPANSKPPSSHIALLGLVAAVLLLLGAAYFAWSRGLLGTIPAPRAPGQQALSAPVNSAEEPAPAQPGIKGMEAAQDLEAPAPSEADPLALLDSPDLPALPELTASRDSLLELDSRMREFDFGAGPPGDLTTEAIAALDQLQALTQELATSYAEFEESTGVVLDEKAIPFVHAVREAYVRRMTSLVELIGKARATDSSGTHPAYMAPDTLSSALSKAGKADPAPVRAAWDAALSAQEEGSRNAKYGVQLSELSKRYEELRRIHEEYEKKFQESPPYSVKNGILGATAAQLLEDYDSLASRLEEHVSQFEAFTDSLDPDTLSRHMKTVMADYTSLAQQDHLYCFRETYSIYSKDRDLSHPAYERLRSHYEFVQSHWPEVASSYVSVYTEYEGIWTQRWATD